MRTLKPLVLGVLFVASTTLTVHAQAPAAPQTSAPQATATESDSWFSSLSYFFNVNWGGQSREQIFTDSSTFDIYGEKGALASAHSIGGGTLFDISAGVRIWKHAGISLAYSTLTNKNDATVSVRVPHPIIFGQSRTASATAPGLEHSENAVHLQFMWTLPITNKFDLTLSAGPSFFTVRQTVATVQAPADISDVPPYTSVTITQLSVTDVKDSPVGGNIGADAIYYGYTFRGVDIGIGGFVRYAGAGLNLPVPAGVTRDTELKTGGTQGGAGLRFRF